MSVWAINRTLPHIPEDQCTLHDRQTEQQLYRTTAKKKLKTTKKKQNALSALYKTISFSPSHGLQYINMLFSSLAITALASLAVADRVKFKVTCPNIEKYLVKPRTNDAYSVMMVRDQGDEFRFSNNKIFDLEPRVFSEVALHGKYLVYEKPWDSDEAEFLVNESNELVGNGYFHLCKVFQFGIDGLIIRDDEPGIVLCRSQVNNECCTPVTIKVEVVAEDLELTAVSKNVKPQFAKPLALKKENDVRFYLGDAEKPTAFEFEGSKMILPTESKDGKRSEYNFGIDKNYMVITPDATPFEFRFDQNGKLASNNKIWLCSLKDDLKNVEGSVIMVSEQQPGSDCTEVDIQLKNGSNNGPLAKKGSSRFVGSVVD